MTNDLIRQDSDRAVARLDSDIADMRRETTAQLILVAGLVLLASLTLGPVPVAKPHAQPSTSPDPITVQTITYRDREERPPPRIIPLPTAQSAASLPDAPQAPANTVQTISREPESIQPLPLYLPAKSAPLPREEAKPRPLPTSQKRLVSFQNYNGVCEKHGKRREDYMKNGYPYWRCSR